MSGQLEGGKKQLPSGQNGAWTHHQGKKIRLEISYQSLNSNPHTSGWRKVPLHHVGDGGTESCAGALEPGDHAAIQRDWGTGNRLQLIMTIGWAESRIYHLHLCKVLTSCWGCELHVAQRRRLVQRPLLQQGGPDPGADPRYEYARGLVKFYFNLSTFSL